MATILSIDQGSSSTKCLLVNEQGEVIARGSAPVLVLLVSVVALGRGAR